MPSLGKSQTIAVFGGSGMVGASILRHLKLSGYSNLLAPRRADVDLFDFKSTLNWLKATCPDVVVMAAALVGGINSNKSQPADFLLQNLSIHTNVIHASWKSGVKVFLLIGSSCVYPRNASQPMVENELLSGSLEPSSEFYALAKISAIKLCEALRVQYSFNAYTLISSNMYGPGANYNPFSSHVLHSFIRRFHMAKVNNVSAVYCWGTGNSIREFTHVDDFADACVLCIEKLDLILSNSTSGFGAPVAPFINIGTGIEISMKELASIVASVVGYNGEIFWDHTKPDGAPRKVLDNSRITSLGWSPKILLLDGVAHVYEDFKAGLSNNSLRL